MRNPNFTGVVSRPRRALGAAAVAGLAGLGLAQAASAADLDAAAPIATASTADSAEVAGVKIDAKRVADPSSSKFTAPLVDTPKSVTVIPSKIIEQTAATSLAGHPAHLAGHHLRRGGGRPAPGRPAVHPGSEPRATTSSSMASATPAARPARSSTWNRWKSSRGRTRVYSGRGSGGGSINLGVQVARRPTSFAARLGGRAGPTPMCAATADAELRASNESGGLPPEPDVHPRRRTPGRDSRSISSAGALRRRWPSASEHRHPGHRQLLPPGYGRSDTRLRHPPGRPRRTWGVAGTDSRTPPCQMAFVDVSRDAYYGLSARDYHEDQGRYRHPGGQPPASMTISRTFARPCAIPRRSTTMWSAIPATAARPSSWPGRMVDETRHQGSLQPRPTTDRGGHRPDMARRPSWASITALTSAWS